MKTILLASVAAAALAAPAWALPDRYEGHPGCIGASGAGCTQQATMADDGNRVDDKESTLASTERDLTGDVDAGLASRAALTRTGETNDDEDLTDEIGDAADDVGDEAEEVGDDVADAASEAGDEISDAADDVGDEISDAFD